MASTRSQLRTQLRTEIKIDPNWKIWTDSTLNNYINRAYLQIQKDWNLDWQENDANTTYTVSAQETALPDDFGKVILVRYNWSELNWTTKTALKREINTFQTATPSRYYLYSNNLWTDTIPTWWTIDLDYKKIIAWFTSDTDESAYKDTFDTAITKYAAFLAWSWPRGNETTAANKLQEYNLEKDTLSNMYVFNDINALTFTTVSRRWYGRSSNTLGR